MVFTQINHDHSSMVFTQINLMENLDHSSSTNLHHSLMVFTQINLMEILYHSSKSLLLIFNKSKSLIDGVYTNKSYGKSLSFIFNNLNHSSSINLMKNLYH
jgi:hypothetical protein